MLNATQPLLTCRTPTSHEAALNKSVEAVVYRVGDRRYEVRETKRSRWQGEGTTVEIRYFATFSDAKFDAEQACRSRFGDASVFDERIGRYLP